MDITFDYISVKSASTRTRGMKTKIVIHGRAWNDAFSAKFRVVKNPHDEFSMQFIDAEIKTVLEKEWRDALAVAVKVLAREEVKRFVGNDLPYALKSSVGL